MKSNYHYNINRYFDFKYMRNLAEVAKFLKLSQERNKISQKTILENTGLTSPTIRGLMSGEKDSKLTTLMAVADELGLELILVPKGVSGLLQGGLAADTSDKTPRVRSLIDSALDRKGE
ncbi:hypothetical protein UNDYM_6021 (plasmid) [Undibacterium sp. YM2]|uniref:helix-turn-helix domain-containing protein n=1 Tax=Undibacterium sp. YM2 TaxID=2058625 RepID=UPI001331E714|nr:hypothetical protein [Undibacterium sp. YM2]BBB70274.1 hypothetical protein UNDYM_6021 [Undibacterium sp. YM2]